MTQLSESLQDKIQDNRNLPMQFVSDYKIMYIKPDFDDEGLNELLGEKLAKIFELNCPRYELATVKGKNFIISEGIDNNGNFLKCSNFSYHDSNNLYDLWFYLESNFNNSKELMYDLIKVYLYDMLFCNFDRHQDNWGVVEGMNDNKLFIFDNSYLFNYEFKPAIFCKDDYDLEGDYMDYLVELAREMHIFKNQCSSEFLESSLELLNLIDDELLNNLIDEVELEAGRKYIERPDIERFKVVKQVMTAILKQKEDKKVYSKR